MKLPERLYERIRALDGGQHAGTRHAVLVLTMEFVLTLEGVTGESRTQCENVLRLLLDPSTTKEQFLGEVNAASVAASAAAYVASAASVAANKRQFDVYVTKLMLLVG